MPGITVKRPRSTTAASGGGTSVPWVPISLITFPSMRIAGFSTGGLPVPSIRRSA